MKQTFTLLLCLLAFTFCYSQKQKKPKSFNNQTKASKKNNFLDKQFYLGFKAGFNLSQADPIKKYTVVTPTNYSPSATEKVYDNFSTMGSQASLEVTFTYKGFSISTQPTYRISTFTYSNQFEWRSTENANDRLIMKYNQSQKVDYADLPLIVKYEITGDKLRPYVQVGVFYSILVNATKTVEVSGTDYASGGINQFTNEPVIVGAKDLFDNYWGLIAGAGVYYNLGNVRLVLDASYHKGMSNIANVKNRFDNDRLSGIGDAQDDLKLNNIVISAGCVFPLRFLSKGYKSLE
jgi:outer membrane protein W